MTLYIGHLNMSFCFCFVLFFVMFGFEYTVFAFALLNTYYIHISKYA